MQTIIRSFCKHNVHCDHNQYIDISRVEELLAGGDADVEDLDTDGQSLISCFSFLVF